MPVTPRWVHSGLVLVAGILSISLTVLILGASRPSVNSSGLAGAPAPLFALKDAGGEWFKLKGSRGKTVIVLAAPAQSPGLGSHARQLAQWIDTYSHEDGVVVVGLQFDPRAGLLTAKNGPGVLETTLPNLRILEDVDASVAGALRVGNSPTLFIIDPAGVIRARLMVENDGALVAATETVTSLREPTLAMPMMSGDRKAY